MWLLPVPVHARFALLLHCIECHIGVFVILLHLRRI